MAKRTSKSDSGALEHTEGGATTRDPMDAGVPMAPGSPDERVGPEDALGDSPTRGDYGDRIGSGPSMRVEVIPEDEREEDGPRTRLVPATPAPQEASTGAGKGGVDEETG